MRFASYGRKSVFSEKSDSIENQFRMTKEYAESHFPTQIDSFICYSDEDYTGANTNRPDLQRLFDDIKAGLIDVLIVYQLDRLSRDVKDFANMYSVLEEHNVNFISVKEYIDTTTPIGKAMMYVTIVFAQMERETIAARVTDNMIGLVKKGYWVGGNPPKGYVREKIEVNGRKHVTIVPDPEGVSFVMDIFDTFLDNNFSLQRMETYFKNKGIRTPSGAFFSTTQLQKILTMPYCVEATPEIYDFYASKGCIMDSDSPREKWDGTHGVMIYGRTTEKNKKHQLNPPSKWLVCLGYHEPFMPSDKWLSVQKKFSQNKLDKSMKYDVPLLKGILRCSCGSIMGVSRKKKVSGVTSHYYCTKRMRQGSTYCNASFTKIDYLDEKVLDIFCSIKADSSMIFKYVGSSPINKPNLDAISQKISSCEKKIKQLASSLALNENSAAAKYIIEEIENLDIELQLLKKDYSAASIFINQQKLYAKSIEKRVQDISNLIQNFDTFTSVERNEIAKNIITSCVWDGETLSLIL